MPQYFIKHKIVAGEDVSIKNEDYYHLTTVRRVVVGDKILLRDSAGNLFNSEIKNIADNFLIVNVIKGLSEKNRSINLVLALALLKGKKYDLAIQKAVEVGVSVIVPIVSERTIPRIDSKEETKISRWSKIASEAAKQCLRDDLPQIKNPTTYQEFIKNDESELKILAHPDQEAESLMQIVDDKMISSVSLVIGPEGGFSRAEIEIARQNNFRVLNIGQTHFKAETAAIVIPAIVLYEINKA
jgi:16S rRNA (uracil1498-N3)-methyltransferase